MKMKIRTRTAFLTPLALVMLAVSSNAAITIADTFSFTVRAGNDATYSSNPGADSAGSDNFTADSPLTVTTTGFTGIGSKVVAVLSLHNSGVGVADPTSITYGGATLTIAAGSNSSFARQMILYVDNVTTDGDFVVNWASGRVDQIGVALFALTGAANGNASYSETNVNTNLLASFTATAGDFILAAGHRNNSTSTVSGAGYTGLDLTAAGGLNAEVAYKIATDTGTNAAPSFSNISNQTAGASNERLVVFAAAAGIPEPSSLILTAVGGLFLIRRRR